jgi:Polysaccharide biosynthesis/export protein
MPNRGADFLLASVFPVARQALAILAALLVCGVLSGCAALTNPVAKGAPVDRLPPEYLGSSREQTWPIPLNLLRQQPPETYTLAPGDVLGVWIEGVLGEKDQAIPVRLPERPDLPTGMGFPVPIRNEGTISLPYVSPIQVRDLSLDQAQEVIRKAYTSPGRVILRPGSERIILTLLRRRQYQVLVFRQDSSGEAAVDHQETGFTFGPAGFSPGSQEVLRATRRSMGYTVDLPAFENDVLHALSRTGGLPGLDSANEIVVQRGFFKNEEDWTAALNQLGNGSETPDHASQAWPPAGGSAQIIRIPLRVRAGEKFALRPEDVILYTGDIVYVPPRPVEVYYAGGLLPAGAFILPRDRDLNVLEAIAQIRGPLVNGGFNVNNLSGALIPPGMGGPSPSLLSVLRKTPCGGQVVIRVDLNRALQDPRERVVVQPGDFLILQETPKEAVVRYFIQVFKFTSFWQAFVGAHESGVAGVTVP